MFRAFLMISCCLIAATDAAATSKDDPYFRSDYKYESSLAAFYKVHKSAKYWTDARAACQYEGASLVVPETQAEINVLVQLINEQLKNDTTGIFVGIHDLFIEGTFMTINGEEIDDIFENWAAGEPNDVNDNEDCVLLHRNSKYYDINCKSKFPFICKKTLATLTANPMCETADKAYFPDAAGDKCYKLHLEPKTWSEAFTICHAEQSYLAIINNDVEAKLLKETLAKHPKDTLKGNFYKDGAYLGFHDQFTEGEFVTVFGQRLAETGYVEWSPGQPDNANKNENCGSIFRSGLLNDINCAYKLLYFCERDTGDANAVGLFSRFQENSPTVQ
uniref:Immulectin 10 n=1 Tax=Hepialus xiaojinensis TaxID=1589740 RepID=A0A219YXK5_9NEOP|nr:immulectin 10 [Hepialus xiaojinensis]